MAILYSSEALPSVTEAARLLDGEAAGDRVLCPGPGHSSRDRSLSVRFDPNAPGGYLVHSYASDDWSACRDYVRERLGLAPWGGPPQAQSRNCLPPAHPARLATLVAHDDFAARTDAAMRIWGETVRLSGTLGERYRVEHRKLDIAALSLGHALRWHLHIQALVALMTDP